MSDPRPIRLFVACGEPSGDVLAAELVRELKAVSPRPVELLGVGGQHLQAEGLKSLFPMEELTVMGLAEVVPRIPNLLRRIRQTAEAAVAAEPDLVLSVDSPDFGFRVQKRIAKTAPHLPRVHYVAPTVWAWRQGRARKMARFLDAVLTLLPFEPAFFDSVGLKAIQVGHPVVERGQGFASQAEGFRAAHAISEDAPLLVVLPGSRGGEIKRLMPVFSDCVCQLAETIEGLTIVLPTLPHLAETISAETEDWPVPVHIVTDEAGKWSAFHAGTAALAASGTVSLELTVARCPSVIAYRLNPLTYQIVSRMVKVDYVSITNLIVGREVLPEYIQADCVPEKIVPSLHALLTDGAAREAQCTDFDAALAQLGANGPSPARRAAEAVLDIIGKKEGAL